MTSSSCGHDRRGDRDVHPLCCVLPPHVLDQIEKRGTDKQKDWARRTLLHTVHLRGERSVFEQMFLPLGAAGRRTVYDARGQTTLPGKIVRTEGGKATAHADADEAYDAAGVTYQFYKTVFGRDSIDGRGMRLDSTVNYGQKFDNAFWNGRQMVYGEGDGEIFNRFTISLDVIGHELTHGVTQFTAGLVYQDQSGALNESMSDVFGSLIKQFHLGQTADKADWLVGAGLFTKRVRGKALRSMAAPGTAYDDPVLGRDPQPAHMRDYDERRDDNGGVHINSGIPNKAFHDAAVAIGGQAWDVTSKIWYEALTHRLTPQSDFLAAAQATIDVAAARYGNDAAGKVRDAWKGVGVI